MGFSSKSHGKNTRVFEITVNYFVQNSMKQLVKLFYVFTVLNTDVTNRKIKKHRSIL